jgi:hypothetical protein
MEKLEISDFEEVLKNILPADKKYVRNEITRLTSAGENYGSVMLAIKIIYENVENEEKETLHAVAKLPPLTDFVKLFQNTSATFRHELGFYQTILPSLRQFQQTQGSSKSLNCFSQFYGGRLNPDPTAHSVDDSAIILLENLKSKGYTLIDRTIGFDLDSSKLILTKLAEFHGAALALKTTQDEFFTNNLTKYFDEFHLYRIEGEIDFMTSDNMINATIKMIEEDELCSLHLNEIKAAITTCIANIKLPKNSHKFSQDTFATVIHGDVWTNNIMVKTHMNRIVDVKFVDLQLVQHASVTRDVLFFLFTSVQGTILKQHLDDLIMFYYQNLTKILEDLHCDTTPYSFDVFKNEMKNVASQIAYFQIMPTLHCVFASENNIWEVEKLNKERLFDQIQTSQLCKNRSCLITREFLQRGWFK